MRAIRNCAKLMLYLFCVALDVKGSRYFVSVVSLFTFRFTAILVPYSLPCTCNRRTFAIEETRIRPRLTGDVSLGATSENP